MQNKNTESAEERRSRLAAVSRAYRAAHPDRVAASDKRKRDKYKEKIAARKKAYLEAHPLTDEQRARRRELELIRKRNNPKRFRESYRRQRESNPERHRAALRKYRSANQELCRQRTRNYMRQWREKNRDVDSARSAEYRKRNPEKAALSSKIASERWKREHRDEYLAMVARGNAKRRVAMLHAIPAWEEPEITDLIYAEARRRHLHVDHIVPLRGKNVCGLHVYYNLQLLTRLENARKGNRFKSEPIFALRAA